MNGSKGSRGRGVKETVSRDFPLFSTWAQYEQAKKVSQNFAFSRRYSRKTCVRVVVDYADTTPCQVLGTWVCLRAQKQSFKNMKTPLCKEKFACPPSQRLRSMQTCDF